MNAGKRFIDQLVSSGSLSRTTRMSVDLYGSLSLTGKGHATDTAIMMGLAGNSPQSVNIDAIPAFIGEVARTGRLPVAEGTHVVDFPVADSIVFHEETLPRHENGMRITARENQTRYRVKPTTRLAAGLSLRKNALVRRTTWRRRFLMISIPPENC